MPVGYKRLSNDELVPFLQDIHAGINDSDASHFERIIKYLIYIINLQLNESRPNYKLCQQIYNTMTLLLNKKGYLINLSIGDDLISAIGISVPRDSDYLFEVVVFNQIDQLVRLFELEASDEFINLIKQFIMTVINTSLMGTRDITFKHYVKKMLSTKMSDMVGGIYQKLSLATENDTYKAVQFVLIINNYEVMQKLQLNQFNFEMVLKKCWFIVTSTKFQVNNTLKSLLILSVTNNLILSDSVPFSTMNLLIEWISAYLNEPVSDNILVSSICQSLLKILKVSVKTNTLHNIQHALNLNYYLNSSNLTYEHPTIVRQVLSIIKNYNPHYKFPRLKDAELNYLIEELQNHNSYELLEFYSFRSGFQKATDLQDPSRLNDWVKSVADLFLNEALNEPQLYTLVSALGNLPCLVSSDFDFESSECTACGSYPNCTNIYKRISFRRPKINENHTMKIYYHDLILPMLKSPLIEDPFVCCNLLLSIYKILASFRVSSPDLSQDQVFNFVKTLMVHQNRTVRVLSSRIFPCFLIDDKDTYLDHRFSLIFQFLSSIQFDSPSTTFLAESTIKAFTEIAIIAEGEWLNALVLRFIDLLGGSNEHHINLVSRAFHDIANAKGIKPYKLLSPFLPVVAVKLIKTNTIFNKILEVSAISRNYFLNLTKEYTAPYLLDYYKYDYIQEIADACNFSKEKLISKCLSKILAVYLVKDDRVNDKYIMNILRNAGFYKDLSSSDIYFNSGIGLVTWNILLQIHYDGNGNITNKAKIYNALEHVAKIDAGLSVKSTGNKEKDKLKYIEILLDNHNLEIIQRIAHCIHHISAPFFEKILAVKAIEFLIKHNLNATASVLSQISTSLQSLIESKEFEFIAINCLSVLVKKLKLNNLISLFDIIISLVFQKFDSFETRSKLVAIEIINQMFHYIGSLQNDYVLYYFSIPFIPHLVSEYKLNSNFKNFKNLIKPKLKIGYFPEFTRRLKTLNKFVVKQALVDLGNFTNQYQDIIQQEFSKDLQTNVNIYESISELINTLLDTSYKFKNELDNEDISTSCAKCLSIIGSLDSNKFNLKSIKPKITLVHNFNDYKENSIFLTDFMENIIVINFWASNNPIKQMHYSFAMQEFMKVLKLDESNTNLNQGELNSKTNTTATNSIYLKVWNNFSDVAKSTLSPFLNSKFFFSSKVKTSPVEYPIFKAGMSHEYWLTLIIKDLISYSPWINDPKKSTLFSAFNALISQNDMSISNYLLKYLVLTNLLNPNRLYFKNLILEISEIFNQNTSILMSADQTEALKACYQTIFEVLDYLNQWRSSTIEHLNNDNVKFSSNDINNMNKNLSLVNEFITIISNYSLYEKSAYCGAYERTILYLEQNYRIGEIGSDFIIENLDKSSSLHSMYANINDLDALDGVLKNFPSRNTNIQLKSFQYNENWSLAQEAFHVLSENGDDNDEYKIKFLKSLNDHAAYEEVLSKLTSSLNMNDLTNFPLDWSLTGLQASIFSGDISQLQKWFYITECIGVPQDVDNLITFKLAELLQKQSGDLDEQVQDLYKLIGVSLNSSSIGTSRNLNLMLQLHMIFDLKLLLSESNRKSTVNLRLENIDQSFETKWKVLSMHKFVNILKSNFNEINQIYLSSSKLARTNNKFHIAVASVMKAMNYNYESSELELETNFEYSQLLWNQGKQTEAIKVLETIDLNEIANNQQKAKIQLQYADWLNESNHSSSKTIIDQYTKAYTLEKNWEKPYFALGKYYDKVLESQDINNGYYQQQIIKCFLKALTLGPSSIFEGLPKLITIWLDFAQETRLTKDAEKALLRIIKDIEDYVKSVPTYVWYTAISQMLSRISHSHLPSVKMLQEIISRVITSYPRQALWFVLSHTNSKDKTRKERVEKIISKVAETSSANNALLLDATNLFSYFISICGKKFKKGTRKVSITHDLSLTQLFEPFSLVIPVRSNLNIKLPTLVHTKKESTVFPKSSLITFNGIDDQVNIFHSLQMPKQITVRGSDGRAYRLMIKKDDTRKDAKVVEFTTLINRLLISNNESRKRNLAIPNYAVTPLAQNMGVIEFVSDVATMKSIVNEERKKSGINVNDRLVFGKLDKVQKVCKSAGTSDNGESRAKLLKVFESILQSSPPVLHNWFINQFSDPTSWYLARNSYIRSSAVMSIVGYIIGLGDRHCENILFFKTNGSVLHIDFDCLFEKGSTLPTPEIVPFRLTSNMVDAMGINKVEGTFRKTCEVTDSILRTNEHSLMNNLETLIYDPLLDWENQQNPQQHLRKVRRKLIGLLDEKEGLPMNIHGQVDNLIQLASSNDNLCQMYGGWAPHI
ncbi:serine/threonine-protein kinase M1 [Yamadazyma tenuis]|uniref:Serine/threonine-protein kinase MEC1 n=1 Tax=Candida tenuis (strain ATCC 10573 / BCRC 21748 / CBS 615 / JCM 9827 / NBRC 10315 / NRRL Y-1498 / VKM Y-70) TaxID=590646 RepID=G3AYY0_CANTC|nr:uncharacterized protein CANTEDRAFT_118930 [Yamadazyma tenuis ATCC 10573]EGV65959.1 hypothetical protein CANTEDRAFT_118930 [Yamadazyma tenuis ATCC 10573]WEJ95708.1 serine/threonine-protein kinase M1 [Yamadazyma tenuis]